MPAGHWAFTVVWLSQAVGTTNSLWLVTSKLITKLSIFDGWSQQQVGIVALWHTGELRVMKG